MHEVYVHACEEQYVVLPTFVDLTPKFGVHKYIYIHIQTQLKLNVLTFEKNICLFKIMKSKELSKK